ncbi:MAG TPA: GFA family protein [Rhizomicrobium sp.]|jgi:hypothetical protein|nr:GFA family protein [Rhizomicrobium sp.]
MPAKKAMFEGGCHCGAVRYALGAAPMFVHCCHCLDCQKQTGGAFVLNALIETAAVKLKKGKPVAVAMPTESGRPHHILRCAKCQVALWSHYGGRTPVAFLRVSTLDKPHAIKPDVHIFTRSKVPWVNLDGPLPKGTATKRPALVAKVYYDMKKEWPAASRARREAAIAGG